MEELIARRKNLKGKLTRLKKKADDPIAQQWDVDTVSLYEKQLDDLGTEFHQLYDDILAACPQDEEEDHQIEYNECADRCDEVELTIKRILRGLLGDRPLQQNRRLSRNQVVQNEVSTKLPKLDIPKFSGNLLEWTTFYDLFKSNVHNHPTLDGAQKLQYLKSLLTGPASDLLQSFQFTDANYNEAWSTLQKRYKNTRELVRTQLTRFMGMPMMKFESGNELTKLVDIATSVTRALKALNRPFNDECDLAMHIITNRLDSETHKQWEAYIGREKLPKLPELLEFLDDRAAILNSSESGKSKSQSSQPNPNNATGRKVAHVHQTTSNNSCSLCKEDNHQIYRCKKFTDMAVIDRRAKAKQLSLCYNCLRTNHVTAKCTSESRCKTCQQKHHTLLHLEPSAPTAEPKPENALAHTANRNGEGARSLLITALVTVSDEFGQNQCYRALMDPGANVSFASERCIQQLGLKRKKTDVDLSGIGDASVGNTKGMVCMRLGSRYDPDVQIDVCAYILPKVTGILPKLPCRKEEISHLENIPLADPYFHQPGAIDLLLGSDIFLNSLKTGHINVSSNLPVALETVFGWVVGGACPSQGFASAASVNTVQSDTKLDDLLERFWRLEEVPSKPILTTEEKICEENFVATTSRDDKGRFIVELPFKSDCSSLGSSRVAAVKRLMQMERKLHNQIDLKQKYVEVMREYVQMGHMELVPEADLAKPDAEVCYLSHHAVIKESSTTTQLRVVYDASAKTSTGLSLNDALMTGPKLQDDLFVILVRFRMFTYAFTADICKMFRQVWIASKHKDFQRIVWRESQDQPIKDYRLTTVTFGTSSAPYLAKRCLQKLAEDGAQKFPLASVVVRRDYYMDDLMSGHFELQSALDLQNEILGLMNEACMPLRKWSSNQSELLENLDPSLRETQLPLQIDADDSVKTLGLHWLPAADQFTFKVNLPPMRRLVTKRTLSSDSAKIFDPLGIVSPVTIVSKMMLQSVWSLGIDWDDSVPEAIQQEWIEYRSGLCLLETLKLERCVRPNRCSSYELVAFSDASEKAMGAVVYVRSKLENGDICVRLVAGKTKLAPLKQVSLPRLELCGDVILVKLIDVILDSFLTKPESIYAFTDSTIVLSWLAKHPKKWNTFVANRVAIIQESLPYESWYHVSGIENPADCASRELKTAELLQHDLWWQGPHWLKDPNASFTKLEAATLHIENVELLEVRKDVTIHHVTNDLSMLYVYSSLWKLTRMTAYAYRFINNCRSKKLGKEMVKTFLTSNEL